MLKSMTAYSRSVMATPLGRFVVELQSVNRKHLEISTHLPKSLVRFDSDIKKWVAQVVYRGQVNVRLSVAFDEAVSTVVKPNLLLASQFKSAWDEIAETLQVPLDQFNLQLLAGEEGLFFYEDAVQHDEQVREVLRALFDQALDGLVLMKRTEGEALQVDISQRLHNLENIIIQVGQKAPSAPGKYREKLMIKLQEVLATPINQEHDERLLKEVFLFADKIDITEEITRFHSHLNQFNLMMETDQKGIGKTLEFILQELNREINTVGSKSADVEISRLVIEIKGELGRIHEQIQNVE